MRFAAIIFAGGKATRLGGVDKVLLTVNGRTLLERSLAAVTGADPIVVVGPRREIAEPVVWVREDPPGAGPLAALATGLAAIDHPDEAHIAVLAGDLIGITPDTIPRLRSTLDTHPDRAGALLKDDEGYLQWMHGVWRLSALKAAIPPNATGRPLKAVLGALPFVEVPAEAGETADVDTPDDLA